MTDNVTNLTSIIFDWIVLNVQDHEVRALLSSTCREWFNAERQTRRHITVRFCYSTSPFRLHARFPSIQSLKINGRPRADRFKRFPDEWGSHVRPWIERLENFQRLNALHFRRMVVTDEDLERIARVKGGILVSMILDGCSGFSTKGVLEITRNCRNLETLVLEHSSITSNTSGEWLTELALHNASLKTLNFCKTFTEYWDIINFNVHDLINLGRRCPLMSVKIEDTKLSELRPFFQATPTLREFFVNSFTDIEPSEFAFPTQLASLGFIDLRYIPLGIVRSVSQSLQKLELLYTSGSNDDFCRVLQSCSNLEVLVTTNIIGDTGLETLARSCRRMRRLRIEPRPYVVVSITERGLLAIADGCRMLECLNAHVLDMTNEALKQIGKNLGNLTDFRLVVEDRGIENTHFSLDNGVKDLLEKGTNIRKFALKVRPGGLSDVGLGYIGKYGLKIRWMLLKHVGETDRGIIDLSSGCPSLEKLEVCECPFTEEALAIAVTRFVSLRYFWSEGYTTSSTGHMGLHNMVRPYWNIELFSEPDTDDDPDKIFAYRSLEGPRRDLPDFVHTFP